MKRKREKQSAQAMASPSVIDVSDAYWRQLSFLIFRKADNQF
jgi:hypothetical protein